MSLRRFVIVAAVISVLHFILAVATVAASLSLGMERFETAAPEGMLETMVSGVSRVLVQPIAILWHSKGSSSLVEWLSFFGNSVLWGIALSSLWLWFGRFIGRRRGAAF